MTARGGTGTTGENMALVRRCWEAVFSDHNLAALEDFVAPSYTWHGPGQDVSGRDAFTKQVVLGFLGAFPDLQITFEDQIVEGDKVASRWTTRGTHQGDLQGIPPTGKQFTMMGLVISRLADGKIAEEWETFDMLGMMQQLGVIPAPEAGTD